MDIRSEYAGYVPRSASGGSSWFKKGEVCFFRQIVRAGPDQSIGPSFFLCVEEHLQELVMQYGFKSATRPNVAVSTTIPEAINGYRRYRAAPYTILQVCATDVAVYHGDANAFGIWVLSRTY